MSMKIGSEFKAGLYCRTSWDIKSGHTEYKYENQQVSKFKRPNDGEPPRHYSVRCQACDTSLSYRLYSEQTSRRRRVLWLGLIPVVLLIGVIGLALMINFGGQTYDPEREGEAIIEAIFYLSLIATGIGGTVVYGMAASNEFGLAGPGMFYGGPTKHKFMVIDEEAIEARPES